MNWGKVDAGLAAALDSAGELGSGERSLSVFVHVEVAGADPDACDRLGLAPPDGEIRTATLSPDEVAELSELPWVRRVGLSRRLRLLD